MPYKPVDQNIKVILGPCIDDTDFKTREEALTYDQAGMEIDVILEKHDGTIVTTAVTPTAAGDYDWTHTDQGYYELELPASGGVSFNNEEEGSLRVVGYATGVLPFSSVTYDVVPEKVWNSLLEGSDNLEVDIIQLLGTAWLAPAVAGTPDVNMKTATATALDLILKNSTFALAIADAIWDEVLTGATHNIATSAGRRLRELGALTVHTGTAQAGAGSTITLDAGASATDEIYVGDVIVLIGGTGIYQSKTIVAYNGTTKVATVDNSWLINPDATTEFNILATHDVEHLHHGTAQAGAAGTITLASDANANDNFYNGTRIHVVSGLGVHQCRLITIYNGTTKIATVSPNWVTNPDATSVYHIGVCGRKDIGLIEGLNATDQINAECDTALSDYDPPTKTEMLEAHTTTDALVDEIETLLKNATYGLAALRTRGDAAWITATGFSTHNAADVKTAIEAVGSYIALIKAQTDALPSGIAKNVALPKFDIFMVLSSDHVTPATGKTIVGQISKDGGAFAGITNAITEVGNGMYTIASGFTQTEMNADAITLKFTADSCDQRIITIYTT